MGDSYFSGNVHFSQSVCVSQTIALEIFQDPCNNNLYYFILLNFLPVIVNYFEIEYPFLTFFSLYTHSQRVTQSLLVTHFLTKLHHM